MHKQYTRADKWTEQVISAAIEVHRHKGPGLLEEIYEKCLMREFELRGMPAVNQVRVPIEYKGVTFDQELMRIPIMVGHRFRFEPDTCSDFGRTPVPVMSDTPETGYGDAG